MSDVSMSCRKRCQIWGVFLSCCSNAAALAWSEPWKREVVSDIAQAGRGLKGVMIQWEGERSLATEPEAPASRYRDSIWFAADGRYRTSFGPIGDEMKGEGSPKLSEYVSPAQVPFAQGNLRTALGDLAVLMPSRKRVLAGPTGGVEASADAWLNQLAMNPVGLAWWVDANADEAERGIFRVDGDQFGVEIPHHGMRCFVQRVPDGSWMVSRIERFDSFGTRTRYHEFNVPVRVSQSRISIGSVRTLKMEKPIRFAGKEITPADQKWYLANCFIGTIPDEIFDLSEGGLVPVSVMPAPKDRVARLTAGAELAAKAKEPESRAVAADVWWYVGITGICGILAIGAAAIRKRITTL